MVNWHRIGAGVAGAVVITVSCKVIASWLQKTKVEKNLKRWADETKGTNRIIIHCIPMDTRIPNASPFVLKALTFLKMAKLDYEIESTEPFGPKGKTPWMSINGENISDSEFMVQYLIKQFNIDLRGSYSEEQLALAEALRIVCDEHLYWGLILERYCFGKASDAVTSVPQVMMPVVKKFVVEGAKCHGIGRHTKDEIQEIISNDLQVISKVLGKKQFILGDEPSLGDAGIFGHLAQFKWALPNNPYFGLIVGQCKNLDEYCERMRARFWPNWTPPPLN